MKHRRTRKQIDDLFIRRLGEIAVECADGMEGLRGVKTNHLIDLLLQTFDGVRRSNGNRDNQAPGAQPQMEAKEEPKAEGESSAT